MSSENVQVAIRVRPLSEIELNSGFQNIVQKICDEPQLLVGGARHSACVFTFNHVFDECDSQEVVYKNSVQQTITKLFEGYNVTILAYGQTGSGKTHTMDTNYNGVPSEKMGIIPRAVLDIFENVDKLGLEYDIIIKCSFVELYNEQLFDLLSNSIHRDECIVEIREDATKGIITPGLIEVKVNSIDDVIRCLVKGSGCRTVGATAMNAESSRSHAIFTMKIEMFQKQDRTVKKFSRFHLVDLAGSERSKKTKATGDRLKEGIKINQGLFALGKCIAALDSANFNSNFVPYRESKLTRLLQDSLGGNSVTLLIACISSADFNMDETLNTLNYANRAKNIKNKPIINQDPNEMEFENWSKKAQALRLEILNLENLSSFSIDNQDCVSGVEFELFLKLKNELKEAQCKNLTLQAQMRSAMINLLNVELKEDLVENIFNELNQLMNTINDAINRLMDNDIAEIGHPALGYMQQVQLFADEIKSLMTSIVDGAYKTAENDDKLELEETSEINDDLNEMNLENFQKKQLGFRTEIQQINQQIAIKEELQKQIRLNLPSLDIQDRITELENKIKSLEIERIDLQSHLLLPDDPTIVSKLSALEKQLQAMTKKHKQQQKLLDLKEADAQRVKQLQIEIKELRAARIRISREMKKCSILHKKWTANKNIEINKIRGLERRKNYEMSRKSVSNKQRQNVLKRRIAEAFAGIKNLEMKIEKKRLVQLGRSQSHMGKLNSVKSEIDIILAIADTEISLDHIKDNREHIISVIELLRQENPLRLQEIASAEKQLAELNKQLVNHHHATISAKKNIKIKKMFDSVSSIDEECEAIRYLIGEILELNKESAEKDAEANAIMKSTEASLDKIGRLQTKQASINHKFASDLNFMERRNEENIGELLRELKRFGDQQNLDPCNASKIMEEARKKKMHYLKIQNELKYENDQLVGELSELQKHKEKPSEIPVLDKIEANKVTNNHQSHATKINFSGALKTLQITPKPINCRCTTHCASKLCKCRKLGIKCSDTCKCNKSCSNQDGDGDELSNKTINVRSTPKNQNLSDSIVDVNVPRYPYARKKRTPFYSPE